MSGSLHSYPHADSSLLQVSIELLCLSITVVQFLFITLTCLFHKKCNRLKARVVIYAYQYHVRLLVRRENRRGEVNARSLDEGIASHIDPSHAESPARAASKR